MRIRIFPYKLGSASARALASALDVLCVKPDGRYKPRVDDLVINWGNSTMPEWNFNATNYLNHPICVGLAVNKLRTFEILTRGGVPTVEWTTTPQIAQGWVHYGFSVVERHNLTGTRGEGIRIVEDTFISESPLYTKLIERAREYRVHVFDGKVIDLQQKKRREGSDSDGTIKNLDNGWVFVRDEITRPPREIFDVATRAVEALGLDFGGVDILTKDGRCYVLEVNSAVGLENSTLDTYVSAIKRYASN